MVISSPRKRYSSQEPPPPSDLCRSGSTVLCLATPGQHVRSVGLHPGVAGCGHVRMGARRCRHLCRSGCPGCIQSDGVAGSGTLATGRHFCCAETGGAAAESVCRGAAGGSGSLIPAFVELARPPVRTLQDTYPTFTAVGVNLKTDEVILRTIICGPPGSTTGWTTHRRPHSFWNRSGSSLGQTPTFNSITASTLIRPTATCTRWNRTWATGWSSLPETRGATPSPSGSW